MLDDSESIDVSDGELSIDLTSKMIHKSKRPARNFRSKIHLSAQLSKDVQLDLD